MALPMNAHASQNRFEPMRELHGSRALHRIGHCLFIVIATAAAFGRAPSHAFLPAGLCPDAPRVPLPLKTTRIDKAPARAVK